MKLLFSLGEGKTQEIIMPTEYNKYLTVSYVLYVTIMHHRCKHTHPVGTCEYIFILYLYFYGQAG